MTSSSIVDAFCASLFAIAIAAAHCAAPPRLPTDKIVSLANKYNSYLLAMPSNSLTSHHGPEARIIFKKCFGNIEAFYRKLVEGGPKRSRMAQNLAISKQD